MILTDEAAAQVWLRSLPEADALALERLKALIGLLREENERQNLVSAASLAQVWLRHIADSAQLLSHIGRDVATPWMDLGTGAGFPGLVVAILRPDSEVVMVESRARRIDWLQRVVAVLGLSAARIEGAPLERVATRAMRVISARAFAPLDRLLELSSRFSTADTLWLLPKGRSARDEVSQLVGWSHLFHVEQSLTDPEAGIVVGTVSGKVAIRKGRKR